MLRRRWLPIPAYITLFVVAVLCMVAGFGCEQAQAFRRGPSPAEAALQQVTEATTHLATVARDVADAVAVVKPTTADDVEAAASVLERNAAAVAGAAETIAAEIAQAREEEAEQTEAIIRAVSTAAGTAATVATGNPLAGAGVKQAAYSLGELIAWALAALGLTGAGAGVVVRKVANKDYEDGRTAGRLEAGGTGGGH